MHAKRILAIGLVLDLVGPLIGRRAGAQAPAPGEPARQRHVVDHEQVRHEVEHLKDDADVVGAKPVPPPPREAGEVGADPRPFAVAVAVAAALSLVSPRGYQTNLMVYGPGGYRYTDFLRAGLPLQLTLAPISITLIATFWPLQAG